MEQNLVTEIKTRKELEQIEILRKKKKKDIKVFYDEFFDIAKSIISFYPQTEDAILKLKHTNLKFLTPQRVMDNDLKINYDQKACKINLDVGGEEYSQIINAKGETVSSHTIFLSQYEDTSDLDFVITSDGLVIETPVNLNDLEKEFTGDLVDLKQQRIERLKKIKCLGHEEMHLFSKGELKFYDKDGKLASQSDLNTPKMSKGKVACLFGGVELNCLVCDEDGKILSQEKPNYEKRKQAKKQSVIDDDLFFQLQNWSKKNGAIIKTYEEDSPKDILLFSPRKESWFGDSGMFVHEGVNEYLTQKLFESGQLDFLDPELMKDKEVLKSLKGYNVYSNYMGLVDALNPGSLLDMHFKGEVKFNVLGDRLFKDFEQISTNIIIAHTGEKFKEDETVSKSFMMTTFKRIEKVIKSQKKEVEKLAKQNKIDSETLKNYKNAYKTFCEPSEWQKEFFTVDKDFIKTCVDSTINKKQKAESFGD